jgi:hypothetical protein
MTKTTNYEISKKLAEIGFRAECSYFYFHSDNNDYEASYLEAFGYDKISDCDYLEAFRYDKISDCDYLEAFRYDKISDCDIEDKYYPAYDLETLLDALPSQFGQSFLQITMLGNQALIGYELQRIELSSLVDGKNESLADTAGRLLILLESKNLIKF